MFSDYHEMFKPVCEFVRTSTDILPYGDHPTLFTNCFTDSYMLLHQNLHESELSEHKKRKAEKLCEFVHNAYEQFLEKAINPEWSKKTVEERQAHIVALCARPQIEQRTDAWYAQAATVLTASEFSSLFGSARGRASLVQAKANPPPPSPPRALAHRSEDIGPLTWGVRFEPVVKQILVKKWLCEIKEMGRLIHATDSFLAASPDGLIVKSPHKDKICRLVEIKCPYTRKVGGDIPFEYWVQMQIQMEVAEIDECEYVECELVSKRPGQPLVDLSGCKMTGNMYLWEKDGALVYEYDQVEKEGWTLVETIPWGLHKFHNKVVRRDRAWYDSTHIWRQAFWTDVQRVKQGLDLLEPVAPMTPKVKVNVCKIQDDAD
jgi:hypothetical protein